MVDEIIAKIWRDDMAFISINLESSHLEKNRCIINYKLSLGLTSPTFIQSTIYLALPYSHFGSISINLYFKNQVVPVF